MAKLSLRPRIGDLLIVGIVLISVIMIILFIFSGQSEKNDCIIMKDNVIIKRIALKPEYYEKIKVDGGYENTIEVADGRVRFLSSDCPNQLCVNSGWISHSGQSAACLPNKVLIKIISDSGQEVDIVAD